jgi:transcriptional regulator with XRE-family HTH domain
MTPAKLRVWREKSGLTQAKAAELAGVTIRHWQRWEAGDVPIPQWLPDVLIQRWGDAP